MLDESQKDLSESTLADMVEAIENAAHITGLRGRWEKLGDAPLVICDIGHNSHGMKVLMPQVERTYKEHNNGRLIMFFGVMKDKDLAAEVGFLPKDAHYLYVNASTPRALPASDLKVKMDEFGFTGEIPVDGSISSGLQWIKENTKPEDFVFIGGSSYVVAEVLAKIDE